MQVSILGPLRLDDPGGPIEVSGTRLRRLIVRLAADAPKPVAATELIDAVWGTDLPADVTNALQTLISRARRVLVAPHQPVQLIQTPGGYQLTGVGVDRHDFAELVRQGRAARQAGDVEHAAETFRSALALHRGEPLAELADSDFGAVVQPRLAEDYLDVLSERISADLELGRGAELIGELEALSSTYVLRESFSAALMTALAGAGRVPEALAVFQRCRARLADELGIDPSEQLQSLHLQLLRSADKPQDGSLPSRKHNLRAHMTSFIGREADIERLSLLLETGRLATVVGPGGAGKTRLAGVVGQLWSERAADGVWFVELAAVTDAANIAQAVLGSIGGSVDTLLERATDRHRVQPLQRLLQTLSDSDCVLVMDNCEHLIDGVAQLVDVLLAQCPHVRVLATSREPLGIDGETLCMLAPLQLPAEDSSVRAGAGYAAVRLFCDRAIAVRPDFKLTEDTMRPVVQIVRRLDGLPLAIELAAARLRVLPVTEIAARLSDRFRLLSGGSRAAVPRHRTLRAVVEWSWELLTPAERALAERLAIFPAGATLASATAICADDSLPAEEIADLLNSLVDKSLLQVADPVELRYRMLETIREYGTERLTEQDDVAAVRLAHAHYFSALVAEAEQWLRRSEQLTWIRLLAAERGNILAALRYLGESGEYDAALKMAVSLGWYWTVIDAHSEAVLWLKFALSLPGDPDSPTRVVAEAVQALNAMASSFGNDGTTEEITERVQQMASLQGKLAALEGGTDDVLLLRAMMTIFGGDSTITAAALTDAANCDTPWVAGAAHIFRANIGENTGDVEAMRADADAALQIFTGIGDRWGLALSLECLARIHSYDGKVDQATSEYEQAARYLVEFGAASDETMMQLALSELYLRQGNIEVAIERAERVRVGRFPLGTHPRQIMAEGMLASVAAQVGDPDGMRQAHRTLSTQLVGYRPPAMHGHVRALALSALAVLEILLGDTDTSRVTLANAFHAAAPTDDMPLVATVGVIVALGVAAQGSYVDAARLLGAAAQLRGADDQTATAVARVRSTLVEALGEKYPTAYDEGRSLRRDDALALLRCAALDGTVEPTENS